MTEVERVPKWAWLIPVILVIVAIGLGIKKDLPRRPTLASFPISAEAQDIWLYEGETAKVKIYPNCWSGWVNLPPGVEFVVDTPGEMEYLFWTGERILVKDKSTQWLGTVPHCSFRIRGTAGEATITTIQ